MSKLRQLIEARRHNQSWQNQTRDQNGRWTQEGKDGRAYKT